jgi:uncharacterized protein YdiU (UPF0061 family)
MSILGLTIDYGPYGWLDDYDPDWTPNTTDAAGRRYRFGYQPRIAQWNLLQLANAVYPLIGDAAPLEAGLKRFEEGYMDGWRRMMLRKLGLADLHPETDLPLLDRLNEVLQVTETDMTLFYRRLADVTADDPDPLSTLRDAYYAPDALGGHTAAPVRDWLASYQQRLSRESVDAESRRAGMNAVNPKFVLRNYLAQLAIDAAEQGDYRMIHQLQAVLRRPYDEHPQHEAWAGRRPDWARDRVGCSMLSCSS